MLHRTAALYEEDRLQLPLVVSLALARVQGYGIPQQWPPHLYKTEESVIVAEPLLVTNLPIDAKAILRPALDFIWNAFGAQKCLGYDPRGNYVGY